MATIASVIPHKSQQQVRERIAFNALQFQSEIIAQVQKISKQIHQELSTLYLFIMTDNRVDQRLNIFQRLIEGLNKKVDLLLTRNHLISQEPSFLNEQSSNKLYKTAYNKPQQMKNQTQLQVQPNTQMVVQQLVNPEGIHQNQLAQLNSQSRIQESARPPPRPVQRPPAAIAFRPMPNQNSPVHSYNAWQGQGNLPNYTPRNAPISGVFSQPNPQPHNPYNNWQARSCCMLWFGLSKLLGGISLLIYGAVLLSQYISPTCSSPYTSKGNQCCYLSVCTSSLYSGSLTIAIVLLCTGFVTGIIGIALLVKAHRFYSNNNESCF